MNTKDTTVGYVLGYNKGYMLGINNAKPKPPLPPIGIVAWNDQIEIVGEDTVKNTIDVLEVIPFDNYCSVHQLYENRDTMQESIKSMKESIGRWYATKGFTFIGTKDSPSSNYYYDAYSIRDNCNAVASIGYWGLKLQIYIGNLDNYISSFAGAVPSETGSTSVLCEMKYVEGSNCKAYKSLNHYWEIDRLGNTRLNGRLGDNLSLPTMPPVTLNQCLWLDTLYGDSVLCCLYAEKDWNVLRTNNGYYICFNKYAYKI